MSSYRTVSALRIAGILCALTGAAGSVAAQEAPVAVADPGTSHLFFAPTAHVHPEGTTTAGVFAYIIPYANRAVTEDLEVGGAVFPLGLLDGELIAFLTPKLRVYDGAEGEVAVGSLSFFESGPEDGFNFDPGVFYVVGTHEEDRLGISAGIGKGFRALSGPIFPFGGIEAVLRPAADGRDGVKLLVEAFAFPADADYVFDGSAMGAATLRFYDAKLAFDVAFLFRQDARSFEMQKIPFIGFSVVN